MTINFPDIAIQNVGQIASHNTYQNENHWVNAFSEVNSVELDVWPRWNWLVAHDEGRVGGHLDAYMEDLKSWRANNPNHDLITIFIEIKSSTGWRVPDFESLLLGAIPNKSDIFSPLSLVNWGETVRTPRSSRPTALRKRVNKYGWPKLSTLKNKVMFVLNGDDVIETYLAERPMTFQRYVPTKKESWPVCFVMSALSYAPKSNNNVVLFNEEYDVFPTTSVMEFKNCLLRAYAVKTGNDDMTDRNDLSEATRLMEKKRINYLCYDNVKNAFTITFNQS